MYCVLKNTTIIINIIFICFSILELYFCNIKLNILSVVAWYPHFFEAIPIGIRSWNWDCSFSASRLVRIPIVLP